MFIQTEQTPNPATLKFIPGVPVMGRGTAEFSTPESAANAPLARVLLGIDDIASVFFGPDFISVTKTADADWAQLKTHVLATIMQHCTSGLPLIEENFTSASSVNDDDDEIVKQIKEVLDTRVRPAVAQDGGDVVFDRFEGGVVYLQMRGACAGCPSATATLKMGIENLLKHYVPEVLAVEPAGDFY